MAADEKFGRESTRKNANRKANADRKVSIEEREIHESGKIRLKFAVEIIRAGASAV
jgi:hypothetical protein